MNYNSKSKSKSDVVIIGGGASGLAVAACLCRAGKSPTVIERDVRVGKKLLATGNGRCNLGHVPLEMCGYHGDLDLARDVFSDWRGSERFFAELGLVCRKDSEGRLYPYSNTAACVLDALRLNCGNAKFICGVECVGITPKSGGFILDLKSSGDMFAKTLIWAAGGADFEPLKKIGHTVIATRPALCPIITDSRLTRSLKGLRINALCRAEKSGRLVKSERGEVQFNDGSLSGICIMNLSGLNADTISLDLAPEFTPGQLLEIIGKRSGYAPEDLLTGLFPKRIGLALYKSVCGGERTADLDKLVGVIKNWRFPVTGVSPFDKAQVTAGGIPAFELNGDLSSKIHPGLYVIGENVNIDGDCGGYNLEWAWASASRAADAIIG